MNVYDIKTECFNDNTYSVVAKNMATAETLFEKEYGTGSIKAITLHSSRVIVQKEELK